VANLTRRMSPSDSRVQTNHQNSARLLQRGGIQVLTWAAFDQFPLDAVVTTRYGGVSVEPYETLNLALHIGDDDEAVLENRRRAAASLGAGVDDLVVANQVHGPRVAVVDEPGAGSRSTLDAVADADGLVTATPGLVLTVLVADCAPVVLFDPQAGVLGCAHAGWRGTLGGVIEETIRSMSTLGADPHRIVAAIGPSVGPARYEVRADVVAAAIEHQVAEFARPSRPDHWLFDLAGAVRAILLRSGVHERLIATTPIETGPPGPFFSARAEGRCGRFALLARMHP
jgi:polyphenol oxidase